MGWSNEDYPGTAVPQSIHHHALIVHRHRQEISPIGGEHLPGRPVARVLHGYSVTRLKQYPGQQIQRLLGSVDDDHLLRSTSDSARSSQVGGNLFSQRAIASRVAVVHGLMPSGSPLTGQQPPPDFPREGIPGPLSWMEIVGQPSWRQRNGCSSILSVGAIDPSPEGQLSPRARGQRPYEERCSMGPVVRQLLGHEGARPMSPPEIAFGFQLPVGLVDGVSRDAELPRERPG